MIAKTNAVRRIFISSNFILFLIFIQFLFLFQRANSNEKYVTLRDMSLGSSGVYTCEASSEAPRFKTVKGSGRIQVGCSNGNYHRVRISNLI